jgi:hypothetical protein
MTPTIDVDNGSDVRINQVKLALIMVNLTVDLLALS